MRFLKQRIRMLYNVLFFRDVVMFSRNKGGDVDCRIYVSDPMTFAMLEAFILIKVAPKVKKADKEGLIDHGRLKNFCECV